MTHTASPSPGRYASTRRADSNPAREANPRRRRGPDSHAAGDGLLQRARRLSDHGRPGLDPRSQCCDTCKQATSYRETAAVLLAVPAETPLPAYTCPATPPLGLVADGSLNADPGAEAACPGLLGSA